MGKNVMSSALVVSVSHPNKNGKMRGSEEKQGNPDTGLGSSSQSWGQGAMWGDWVVGSDVGEEEGIVGEAGGARGKWEAGAERE